MQKVIIFILCRQTYLYLFINGIKFLAKLF